MHTFSSLESAVADFQPVHLTIPASGAGQDAPGAGTPAYTVLRHHERPVRVALRDILYVAADNYYCRVVTSKQEYTATMTLKKFLELLPAGTRLMRIHRSHAVNLDHVREVRPAEVLVGEDWLPVSRSKKELLLRRLEQ